MRRKRDLTTPSRCLIEFDLVGAEWVVVAYLAGDARMLDIVENKKKPHLETGHYLSGVEREIIMKERALVKEMTDFTEIEAIRREHIPEIFQGGKFLPRNMSVYQCGKKSNHGLNYIMGERRFSEETDIPEGECKKIIHYYTREAYVNIPLWWESIKRELKNNNRTLETCFGDKRRFLEQWGNELFKAATAYVPQSTVSRICTTGMSLAFNDNKLTDYWDLEANVHDSLLWQALFYNWLDLASQIVSFAYKHMHQKCKYGGREFYLDVECKIGKTWGSLIEVPLSKDVDRLASDLKRTWELIHEKRAA